MELNLILRAKTPVKIHQIDAAAQQNVLAIVDHLTAFSVGSGYRP
jgi:hypothetical protein